MVNWPFSIGVDMKLSDLGGTIFPPNDIVLYLALLSNDDISCLSTLLLYFFFTLLFSFLIKILLHFFIGPLEFETLRAVLTEFLDACDLLCDIWLQNEPLVIYW